MRRDEVEMSRSASLEEMTPIESEICCARERSERVAWAGSTDVEEEAAADVSGCSWVELLRWGWRRWVGGLEEDRCYEIVECLS